MRQRLVYRSQHRSSMRQQGQLVFWTTLPLVVAATVHLITGGGWALWVLAGAVATLCLAINVARRRSILARQQRAKSEGRSLWRVGVTSASLASVVGVPKFILLARDLIPADVDVTADALELTLPSRYRRLGMSDARLPWRSIEQVRPDRLGHVRPDGMVSTRNLLGVVIISRDGRKLELVFEANGEDFLARVGQLRADRS